MFRFIICLAAALGLLAASNVAQAAKGKQKPTPEQQFKNMDKDNDNKLSPAEYNGKRKDKALAKAQAHFKKADKDGDGYLSHDEFIASKRKVKKNK